MNLTAELIQSAAGCGADTARGWLPILQEVFAAWDINTPARVAAFLAQVGHESGGLTRLEENLNYSAEGLARTWPGRFALDPKAATKQPNALALQLARNPQAIANHVYASRLGNGDVASGDGWAFRGRGLIQLTGRTNYRLCGKALAVDLEANPDRLRTPPLAARSAAWFWKSNGLNELADKRDLAALTLRINGGTLGMPERLARYEQALAAMA